MYLDLVVLISILIVHRCLHGNGCKANIDMKLELDVNNNIEVDMEMGIGSD